MTSEKRRTKGLIFGGAVLAVLCALLLAFCLLSLPSDFHAEAVSDTPRNTFGSTDAENFVFVGTNRTVTYNGSAQAFPISVTYNGEPFTAYTVSYALGSDEPVFTAPKDAGVYTVVVAVEESTPVISRTYTYTISPKTIPLVLSGESLRAYNGRSFFRDVSPQGICAGDEQTAEVVITYTGEAAGALDAGVRPVNADNYTLSFAFNTGNYVVGEVTGALPATLSITKRELTATAENVTVNEGQTPDFKVKLTGFVGGEDATVVTQMPTVTSQATQEGMYKITPSGGTATNYIFRYADGVLTINGSSASGKLEGSATEVKMSGIFNPNTTYTGTVLSAESERGKQLVNVIRAARMLNFTSEVVAIYDIIPEGDGGKVSEIVKISLTNVSINTADKHVVFVVDENGVAHKITNFSYVNGTLSFNSYATGAVVIVSDSLAKTLWIAGGSVFGIVLIMLLIGARVTYYNDKKDIAERKAKKKLKRGEYNWD